MRPSRRASVSAEDFVLSCNDAEPTYLTHVQKQRCDLAVLSGDAGIIQLLRQSRHRALDGATNQPTYQPTNQATNPATSQ